MQCSFGQMPPFFRERELPRRTTSTTTHALRALLTFVAVVRQEASDPILYTQRQNNRFRSASKRRMVHRVAPSSCSLLLVAALFVLLFAAALGPNAAVDAVLLNFEGAGNNKQVGSFYGPGGIGSDYGIFFGTTVKGAIDTDVTGGTFTIANVPSPSTALYM
jgi:hypothetical protein